MVHALFIGAAVLLSLLCAGQAFGAFRAHGSGLMAAAAIGATLVALVLVGYEARFLRRCREEGIR
jgi:hypothetical protein